MSLKDDVATTVESMFSVYSGSDMSNTALRKGAVADTTEKIMAAVTTHTAAHFQDHLTNAVADLADGIRGVLARIDKEDAKEVAREKKNLADRYAEATTTLERALGAMPADAGVVAILKVLGENGWHTMNFGEYHWENG